MTGQTLRIGLRAAALSFLGGASLFNNDVRAQEGCNNNAECRGTSPGEYCAQDESTGDSHCDWSIWEGNYQCLTGGGSCDQS